jgi:signal transduction histidine kinase
MTSGLGYDFTIRFLINMVAILVLIRLIYFNASRHRAYASSFILFGMGVFLVTGQLASVDISMGFAFGLFAIFSMLRYRTESITIKEMTYLFLVIAMALLSAIGTMSHLELALILAVICGLAYITETSILLPNLEEQSVEYEKIENIVPERKEELLQDLRERLGQDVRSVEIVSVDFLRDTARLKVQFVPSEDA